MGTVEQFDRSRIKPDNDLVSLGKNDFRFNGAHRGASSCAVASKLSVAAASTISVIASSSISVIAASRFVKLAASPGPGRSGATQRQELAARADGAEGGWAARPHRTRGRFEPSRAPPNGLFEPRLSARSCLTYFFGTLLPKQMPRITRSECCRATQVGNGLSEDGPRRTNPGISAWRTWTAATTCSASTPKSTRNSSRDQTDRAGISLELRIPLTRR